MKPWDHLIEADRDLRGLQRKWKTSGTQQDLLMFLAAYSRSDADAKSVGLDHQTLYEKDFDDLAAYCRTKLRGKVVVSRGNSGSVVNVGNYRVMHIIEFYKPDAPDTFERFKLYYYGDAKQREGVEGLLVNQKDSGAYRKVFGFVVPLLVNPQSPESWTEIRRLANKAIQGVFGPVNRIPGHLKRRLGV